MTGQPKIEIFNTTDELFHAAAEAIAGYLAAAIRARGRASFVLTGGNTPKAVYELLAASPLSEHLDWRQVLLFWGDERCVPPDDPASNYGMAWRTLISRLLIPAENIHRILGELADPTEAAELYENGIRSTFPRESPPSFDLVLLGMGDDGHTASLFPGTTWDEERWVVANYVARLESNRVTMTPRILNAARKILFLTSGSSKASALAGVLEDRTGAYPAKRIQPQSGDLTWMVDKAAASLLRHDAR